MFGNFIYIIIVLLIYLTYQPTAEVQFDGFESMALLCLLTLLFTFLTAFQFKRIRTQVSRVPYVRLDNRFDAVLTRQSIMAIVFFAISIYGLNLTWFTSQWPVVKSFPTVEGLLCVGLFIFYLTIVWYLAFDTYRSLYPTDLSRRSYVLSNITFNLPVIFPWLALSACADIIGLLPFETPKRFLDTTAGEVTYFFIFLFVIAFFGPAVIQKFWRCRPLEDGETRRRIEALCQRAGLQYANILYWPIFGGRMITAGVMGLAKRFRYLLVTRALLRYLEPGEVDAVITHEIGHVKKLHLLFYLFFFAGYLLISYAVFDLIILSILYAKPLAAFLTFFGLDRADATPIFSSAAIILIFFLYFRYVFGYFMRNFERQADTYVYTLFNNAQPLIATLEKIALSSGQSPEKPNWHHFSIAQRMAYLKKCEADRSWVKRHDKKIKKSIIVYLSALVLVGTVAWQLNFGETGQRINHYYFEKIIRDEIEKDPGNAELFAMLGDFYQNNQKYQKAVEAYERSLKIDSGSVQVLNNLAWLYATCENQTLRDPTRALELAGQAADREQSPHVMDTLGESYFINGLYKEAVAAGLAALRAATENRTYYRQQLEKYAKALHKAGQKREGI